MSVVFCAWYNSLICFQLAWPSLCPPYAVYGPMSLVCANLGTFLFLCVNFHGGIPSKSLLQSACCLFPSCFFTEFQACGSGCPRRLSFARGQDNLGNFSWYFIDFLTCLNGPISGTFICPNAQLLWNSVGFHPPRLNKWNSVCSKNTLCHGMKQRSQPHWTNSGAELGGF